MPYVDNVPHAGSAEVLTTGMYTEPAGTIARTVSRDALQSSTVTGGTTGQVVGRLIALPSGMVIRNISILFGTTGATGPTHWWFGLADIQLNVLGVTADQLTAAIGVSQFSTLALTQPVSVPSTGAYYVLASVSTSTTQPNYYGGIPATAPGNIAPLAWGTAGTQAAPPAVGAQLAGGTLTVTAVGNIAAWLS